jgi:hypothetical protein
MIKPVEKFPGTKTSEFKLHTVPANLGRGEVWFFAQEGSPSVCTEQDEGTGGFLARLHSQRIRRLSAGFLLKIIFIIKFEMVSIISSFLFTLKTLY